MSDAPARPAVAAPRDSATVMLLREAPAGVEVLVIRRHEELAFMGGMWVFPGGALAAADSSPAALARIPAASQVRCRQFVDRNGAPLERTRCLALRIAACRETFEETGVLLATDERGAHCSGDLSARMQSQRLEVASRPELFTTLLAQQDLLLETDHLVYWAHWITPSASPRRFDTRFFAAVVPAEQTPVFDAVEAVEHAWMTPAALLDAARDERMRLSPPTRYSVMDLDASLRRHASLENMLHEEALREVPPVLPKSIRGAQPIVLMPWDAEYEQAPGEGASSGIEYPESLRRLPSRVTFSP